MYDVSTNFASFEAWYYTADPKELTINEKLPAATKQGR